MSDNADRLVRRLHRRLSRSGPVGRSVRADPRDIAELEARVRRLRAMDVRLIDVQLSRYVTGGDAFEVSGRVGGAFVATEV